MRALGALAVILGPLGMGLLLLRERRRRLAALRELEEALRLMAGELSLRRPALGELLVWLAGQSEGSAALFFRQLARSMPRLGEKSFFELWEEAATRSLPELNAADRRELSRAGRVLGRFELSQQLAGLESCRLRLAARREQGEARFGNDRRLLLALPAAAGCLLLILLM